MERVRQLQNKNGNAVANQYIIYNGSRQIFQSYDTTIAIYDWDANTLTLSSRWTYSNTTQKYLYQFILEQVHMEEVIGLIHSKNKRGFIKKLIDSNVIIVSDEVR